MFRLHIDVPVGTDLNQALEHGKTILTYLEELAGEFEIQFRLGKDDDRQRSNYFQINENGHCSNKKSRL